MKLKQHLIIKQYFIDYSLGVYDKSRRPTVSGNVARILEQDNYENVLDITKLVTKDDGDIGVIFESPDLVTEEQVYTLNVVNNQFIFNGKYIEANSYPSVEDIPMETNNVLVAIDKDGKKNLVLLVDREFAKLSEEEQKTTLLNIFKQQVRIDFDTPEEIAGVTFDLNDSVWKAKDNKLNIHSAVIKGDIEVFNDNRRYDLLDTHIGKLGLKDLIVVDEATKTIVMDTDGELHEIYLVGEGLPRNQIPGKDIYFTMFGGGIRFGGGDLKGIMELPEEPFSDPGGVPGNKVYKLSTQGTPNLEFVPKTLPSYITSLSEFGKNSKINDPVLSTWDYSNIDDLYSFLDGAKLFNQDLSQMCLEKVSRQPYGFLRDTAYDKERPVFGECPNGMSIRLTPRSTITTNVYFKLGEVTTVPNTDIKIEVIDKSIKISGKDLSGVSNIPKKLKRPFAELGVNHLDLSGTGINAVPKYLDESEWITSYKDMVKDCVNITEFDVNIPASLVSDAEGMFEGCYGITEGKIGFYVKPNPNVDDHEIPLALKSLSRLFKDCSNMQKLKINDTRSSSWAARAYGLLKVTDTSSMLENCSKLTTIESPRGQWDSFHTILDQFRTSILTNTSKMFKNCKLLEGGEIEIHDWSALENADEMFMGCDSAELSITNWHTPKIDETPKDFATTSKGAAVWKTPVPVWGRTPVGVTFEDGHGSKFVVVNTDPTKSNTYILPGTGKETVSIDSKSGGLSIGDHLSYSEFVAYYKIVEINSNLFGNMDISLSLTGSVRGINLDNVGGIRSINVKSNYLETAEDVFNKTGPVLEKVEYLYIENNGLDFTLPKLNPRVIKVVSLNSLREFNSPIEWSEDPSKIDPSELTLEILRLRGLRSFNQPIEHLCQYNELEELELNELDAFDQPIAKVNLGNYNEIGRYPTIAGLKAFNQIPPKPNPKDGIIDLRDALQRLDVFNQDLGDWVFNSGSSLYGVGENCPKWTLPKPGIRR